MRSKSWKEVTVGCKTVKYWDLDKKQKEVESTVPRDVLVLFGGKYLWLYCWLLEVLAYKSHSSGPICLTQIALAPRELQHPYKRKLKRLKKQLKQHLPNQSLLRRSTPGKLLVTETLSAQLWKTFSALAILRQHGPRSSQETSLKWSFQAKTLHPLNLVSKHLVLVIKWADFSLHTLMVMWVHYLRTSPLLMPHCKTLPLLNGHQSEKLVWLLMEAMASLESGSTTQRIKRCLKKHGIPQVWALETYQECGNHSKYRQSREL